MVQVCMTTDRLFDRYDEVIDEVGVSDDWLEEEGWFAPLGLEALRKLDGIEQIMHSVVEEGVPGVGLVAMLRTVEPLAPWGETGRCGIWYLFRERQSSSRRLIAVGKGQYDHRSHLFTIKRLVDTNDGRRMGEYMEFLQACIQHCRERATD